MNKFSLALAMTFTFAPLAAAQTVSVAITKPCVVESPPGRPTLKRREPEQENETAPTGSETSRSAQQPCDESISEASVRAHQEPLPFRFEGLTVVPESDVRKFLRERRGEPSKNSDTDSVTTAATLIRDYLSQHGYRHAEVSSRLDQNANEPSIVTFVISEGPRLAISDIKFQGNSNFQSQVLREKLTACMTGFHQAEPGIFDGDVFDYCLHYLAGFERSRGYLQARFSEPAINEIAGGLVITINAEEGVLYRVGNFQIAGADHVSEQEVRALIDMRTGDIANGEKLAKALYEDLKATYGEKGFIQYTAEIEPEFHAQKGATEGVVDFTITIDEGHRYKVRKVSFKGDDLAENELRRLMLVREGEVYNQALFEQSVRRINDSGLFDFVDKDKDVDYRTNEEENFVDVQIKLTKKTGL